MPTTLHLRPGSIGSVAARLSRPATFRRERATGSARVDPRIASRRAQVQGGAEAARRRRRLLAAGAVGSVTCLVALAYSPMLGVRTIDITGTTEPARIREASGVGAGTPLVRIDGAKVRRRLLALPDIAQVTVTRHWPRQLSIAVVTHRAVGLIVGPTNTAVVGANGSVIRSLPSAAVAERPGLPVLEGVAPSSPGRQLLGDGALLGSTAAILGPIAQSRAATMQVLDGHVVVLLRGVADPRQKAGARSPAVPVLFEARFGTVGDPDLDALKARALEAMLVSGGLDGYRNVDLGVPDAPVLGG